MTAVLTAPPRAAAGLLAAIDELCLDAAAGAAERDRDRVLPYDLVRRLADTGFTTARVPAAAGGPDLPRSLVVEATRRLAVADPNLAQIPQSHAVVCELGRLVGGPAVESVLWPRVLDGDLVANAQAERGAGGVVTATACEDGPDVVVLDGEKHFCTGSLFADLLAVFVCDQASGGVVAALVDPHAPGVERVDDWDGLGQRTTASGTVRLRAVRVPRSALLSRDHAVDAGGGYGAFAQSLHAAIDTGLARSALEEAASRARRRNADDPLVAHRLGELTVQVRAAEALVQVAGSVLDDLDGGSAHAGEASLAVATAKVAADRAALAAADAVVDLGGATGAVAALGADRHWRDARTHTLHDPVRWKTHALGRALLTGEPPVPSTVL